jgi:hypothetical protein
MHTAHTSFLLSLSSTLPNANLISKCKSDRWDKLGSSALNERPDEEAAPKTKGYAPQYAVTGQGLHYRMPASQGGAVGLYVPAQETCMQVRSMWGGGGGQIDAEENKSKTKLGGMFELLDASGSMLLVQSLLHRARARHCHLSGSTVAYPRHLL